MGTKYTWNGYLDYFKQELRLSQKIQRLPLKKQIRIWTLRHQVLFKYCRTYLRRASLFTLLSPFVFYVILAIVVLLDVKYNIALPTIPVVSTIAAVFFLLCYINIKLIPIKHFPLMLEKLNNMIEDIDEFEKNELATNSE